MMRGLAAVAVVLAMVAGTSAAIAPDLRDILARELKFSNDDLAALDRGAIVKRSIRASAPGEVAAVGAVRVRAAKEKLVDEVRDIVAFKRGRDVVEIGRFSNPPTLADLDRLTITRADLDMRSCRVGDCDIRLPADTIGRFQHEIDWRAPDADLRAAALFKEVLLDHVRAYLTGSSERMTSYDDGRRSIRPVDDFLGLMRNSPYIGELVPGLPAYLEEFPAVPLAGAEDFLYWSKEKFGIEPFITVTHVTIVPATAATVVIASKDVYSSRYIDASLTTTIASDVIGDPNAFYLVYVNRSRANAVRGAFSSLRRAIVERRAKSSLEEHLLSIRTRLEGSS